MTKSRQRCREVGLATALLALAGQGNAEEAAATSESAAPKPANANAPELDVLTIHRSTYLLSGFTRRTQVKLQFSVKYDLWPSRSHHTVFLAYSQKSLWDLYDPSAPFRESNYAPELFYAHYHSEIHGQPDLGCGLFSEQAGFEHESNGEEGETSRSWNRVFVNVEATCAGESAYGLLGLRVWYPLWIQENPSISETQGYSELVLGAGLDRPSSHSQALLTVALRKGASRELRKGSVLLDGRWRPTYEQLFGKAWRFAPFLWAQLFTGYGETLGTFDSATTSFRAGFGLSDRAR
jgi:phospholipase A1/A2